MRLNYDEIAHLYDEPSREHAPDEDLFAFIEEEPQARPRVLDVGCGTGSQLAANRTAGIDATLVGVDRFVGMLRVAERRTTDVAWIHGDGMTLPIADEVIDYATNQFSYQHIADEPGFVRELMRVLRPGGRFVLTNVDPWSMRNWAIYQFFPEAWDRDSVDFLPTDQLVALLEEVGFIDVRASRTIEARTERLVDVLDYCSQRHRTSQFMVIPRAAWESGVERVRRALAAEPEGTVSSELCWLKITAAKPSR